MSGYTVNHSIDMINLYCDDPAKYKRWQLREAMNDAEVHYEYGNASKDWYEYVIRTLSPYA